MLNSSKNIDFKKTNRLKCKNKVCNYRIYKISYREYSNLLV